MRSRNASNFPFPKEAILTDPCNWKRKGSRGFSMNSDCLSMGKQIIHSIHSFHIIRKLLLGAGKKKKKKETGRIVSRWSGSGPFICHTKLKVEGSNTRMRLFFLFVEIAILNQICLVIQIALYNNVTVKEKQSLSVWK